VRENQAVGSQAIAAGAERDGWREQAADASQRAAAAEASSRAAAAEAERLRKAYEVRAAIFFFLVLRAYAPCSPASRQSDIGRAVVVQTCKKSRCRDAIASGFIDSLSFYYGN